MKELNLDDVRNYVEMNISKFHDRRLKSLDSLKLNDVLKRKNPYLFKAKNTETSDQLVRGIVDAHISSHEETIFGVWLEDLAIFINNKVYGGWKSGTPSIDLEFDKDGIRYIVNIKSSFKWANKEQKITLSKSFKSAIQALRTSNSKLIVIAVNGCCYGRDDTPDKGDYFKYCGQRFWEFISGNENLYIDIIEPLGFKAKERNLEFQTSYNQVINRFIKQFSNDYCTDDGDIDWNKLVAFNAKKRETK